MRKLISAYARLVELLSNSISESLALLFMRVALAVIFWRAGRSKLTEGSMFEISDGTRYLFSEEYKGVPLPADIAAPLATGAEHLFPILLVLGLATRLSAFALLIMTLVIQIFVYPDAWWGVHNIWVAMCLMLIVRGGGIFAADKLFTPRFIHKGATM